MPARTIDRVSGHSTRMGAAQDLAELQYCVSLRKRWDVSVARDASYAIRVAAVAVGACDASASINNSFNYVDRSPIIGRVTNC